MDAWLVSKLTKNEWALLGALLLVQRDTIELKSSELMARAGLSKNTYWSALSSLQMKGYIQVEDVPGKASRISLKGGDVHGLVIESSSFPLPETPVVPEAQVDVADGVIDIFKKYYPTEQAKYPLSRVAARRWYQLAGEDMNVVTDVIQAASTRAGVRAPKAYIEKILPQQVTLAEPDTAELIEWTERMGEVASRQRPIGGSIAERRRQLEGKSRGSQAQST